MACDLSQNTAKFKMFLYNLHPIISSFNAIQYILKFNPCIQEKSVENSGKISILSKKVYSISDNRERWNQNEF